MNDFWKQAVVEHDHRLIISLLAAGLRLDEARDVAQEAWLRLIEASSTGRLDSVELPGLVIRQASFIVADRARSRRLRPLTALRDAEVQPAIENIEAQAQARQSLEAVRLELAVASPRAQSVFLAAVLDAEVGHRTLAKREGLSLQRFRQVLCEVRAKLRQAVDRS